jgi:hypothetical protein
MSNTLRTAMLLLAVTGAAFAEETATATATHTPTARDHELLCYLDKKMNSLGAVLEIDGASYRCTSVLTERGVRSTAWVEIRSSQARATG